MLTVNDLTAPKLFDGLARQMFESFFIAGFEGATGIDRHGRWFDQIVATAHDRQVENDYRLIAEAGFRAARECIRWPLVDLGHNRYDFRTVQPMVDAARNNGVDVIWDLFHFGYPADLDLLGPDASRRFAEYCAAVVRYLAVEIDTTIWITPINEPSYFAFAAGGCKLFAPHLEGRAPELKRALVSAAIAGINAIRATQSGVRFINVDPLCHVCAPAGRPDLDMAAVAFNDRHVFEAWDMLSGRICPELGGSPSHLDVVGVNYYWTNQWELEGPVGADGVSMPLADRDPRRVPLRELIVGVMDRYGPSVLISETGHFGPSRADWLLELTGEMRALNRIDRAPMGVCLYPIMGMTDWHDTAQWLPMGLWESSIGSDGVTRRHVHAPMLEALRAANIT